jgi:hypothetical protein
VTATNAEMGGDPCPGASKYLRVNYICKGKVNRIPEGETETIQCPEQQKIRLVSADYGRSDGEYKGKDCSKKVMGVLMTLSNNKQS